MAFPLIQLPKKLCDVDGGALVSGVNVRFPLIQLPKKLCDLRLLTNFDGCTFGLFPLIQLPKKLCDGADTLARLPSSVSINSASEEAL